MILGNLVQGKKMSTNFAISGGRSIIPGPTPLVSEILNGQNYTQFKQERIKNANQGQLDTNSSN